MSFEPIAIVGRGCVFPGALNPEALWELTLSSFLMMSSTMESSPGVAVTIRRLAPESERMTVSAAGAPGRLRDCSW